MMFLHSYATREFMQKTITTGTDAFHAQHCTREFMQHLVLDKLHAQYATRKFMQKPLRMARMPSMHNIARVNLCNIWSWINFMHSMPRVNLCNKTLQTTRL